MTTIRKMIREIASRSIAIIFGILTAWLLIEILLRVTYPVLPYIIKAPLRYMHVTPFSDTPMLPVPAIAFDNEFQVIAHNHLENELQYLVPSVPLHITTSNWLDPNSHVGFRVPAADCEPRWPVQALFIGDSFTFCFTEYEDCWVQILSDKYGMSVVNMGQTATGSISHLHILQKFGLLYKPQIVVWQWYGNDYNEDYGMATKYMGMEPVEPPTPKPATPPQSALEKWLNVNSAVYIIYNFVFSSEAEQYQLTRSVDPYHVQDGGLDIYFGRDTTMIGHDVSLPRNEVGLELSQQAIRDSRNFLDQAGIPLVLVLIPTKEEVYARWTEPILGKDALDALREGRQRMLDFCEEEGLICLDMTETLTAAASEGQQVYFVKDNHINAAGNAIVADTVWQFLQAQQLVARP